MGMTPNGVERIPIRIIELLEKYKGSILTKKFIYEKVWGEKYDETRDPTIYSNIRYARDEFGAEIELAYERGYVLR